jgi:hypothetical protein
MNCAKIIKIILIFKVKFTNEKAISTKGKESVKYLSLDGWVEK